MKLVKTTKREVVMKTVLITGATSGIGMEFARRYAAAGYRLIITGRRTDRLEQLKDELEVPVDIYTYDLSKKKQCFELLEALKEENIDIFINNAGFGLAGAFLETDIEKEVNMIKVNDMAMHILFKGILQNMHEAGDGYILNVASDCVINDYLSFIRKKEMPDNLITPEYLKEKYGVEYHTQSIIFK